MKDYELTLDFECECGRTHHLRIGREGDVTQRVEGKVGGTSYAMSTFRQGFTITEPRFIQPSPNTDQIRRRRRTRVVASHERRQGKPPAEGPAPRSGQTLAVASPL